MAAIYRRLKTEGIRKLMLFLAVGGTATATYASISTILTLRFPSYKAQIGLVVYAGLIPIAFLAQRYITFQSRGSIYRELCFYTLLQTASIMLSSSLLVRYLTDNPYLNFVIFLLIAGGAAIISFALCNLYIFRNAIKSFDRS